MRDIIGHRCGRDGCGGRAYGADYTCLGCQVREGMLLPPRQAGPRVAALALTATGGFALAAGLFWAASWALSLTGLVFLLGAVGTLRSFGLIRRGVAAPLLGVLALLGLWLHKGFLPALAKPRQDAVAAQLKVMERAMPSLAVQAPPAKPPK